MKQTHRWYPSMQFDTAGEAQIMSAALFPIPSTYIYTLGLSLLPCSDAPMGAQSMGLSGLEAGKREAPKGRLRGVVLDKAEASIEGALGARIPLGAMPASPPSLDCLRLAPGDHVQFRHQKATS